MDTAVILAGGKGLRLDPTSRDLPKPMILINNKPIIEYIVLLLKKLDFKLIYIVVGYKKELIIDYLKNGLNYDLKIEYIENKYINDKQKSGLSDAVMLARDFIKEKFLVILGDEIYVQTKHKEMIKEFKTDHNCSAMVAVYETQNIEDVKKNYSIKIDNDWNIVDMKEKPTVVWNNLVGCGTYLFSTDVFSYIDKTSISPRTGRKELADTMKLMILDKKIVKGFNVGGKYLNINYPEDIQTAKELLMKK